jgi:hypothetical protein
MYVFLNLELFDVPSMVFRSKHNRLQYHHLNLLRNYYSIINKYLSNNINITSHRCIITNLSHIFLIIFNRKSRKTNMFFSISLSISLYSYSYFNIFPNNYTSFYSYITFSYSFIIMFLSHWI